MKLYPVAILVGGIATRLRPITEKIPKALIELAGEPFIVHQLRLLKSSGFSDVVICAWYHGEMIRDYVKDGAKFGLIVTYSFDGDLPLGTAGAVRKAIPLLGDNYFVLYGDSYLPCDYRLIQSSFESQNKQGLMTVYRNNGKWDSSNVEYLEGKLLSYDKKINTQSMRYIDYGLGVFNKKVFDTIPEGMASDLEEIYKTLIIKNELAAYEVNNRFYEIGSKKGLMELDQLLSKNPSYFLKGEK
jgi:NDP-sugar pyrophosphorylase family protein